jgi:GATA-binding protein
MGSGGSGEEMDEDDSPRRKRPRKARNAEPVDARRGRSRRGRHADDGDAADEDDEDERMRTRKRSREAHDWADGEPADEPRYGFGGPMPARGHSFTGVMPGVPTHAGFAGLDLPPLPAVLGPSLAGLYAGAPPPLFAGAQSSYLRSGSAATSRAHSPLAPHSAPAAHGGYVLPPPLGRSRSPGGRGTFDAPVLPPPGVPTLPQLEHHYRELGERRRWLEDMLAKTDAIMAGVQRGIEDMRAQASPPALPRLDAMRLSPPAALALPRARERDAPAPSVWPHAPASPAESRASSLTRH